MCIYINIWKIKTRNINSANKYGGNCATALKKTENFKETYENDMKTIEISRKISESFVFFLFCQILVMDMFDYLNICTM